MKSIIFVSVVTMILAGAAVPAVLAQTQSWMTNTVNVRVTEKLAVCLCHESRYAGNMSFADPFLDGLQGGLNCKLPSKFYVGALYRRENYQTRAGGYRENRATVEGGWTPDLFGGIRFYSRLRVESRHFGNVSVEDHIRVRAKAGLSHKARFGRINLAPFVSTEVFGDDRDHWDTYINRNRFLLGTKIILSDHLGFTVNYVRQDTKGLPVVHAVDTGLNLSL